MATGHAVSPLGTVASDRLLPPPSINSALLRPRDATARTLVQRAASAVATAAAASSPSSRQAPRAPSTARSAAQSPSAYSARSAASASAVLESDVSERAPNMGTTSMVLSKAMLLHQLECEKTQLLVNRLRLFDRKRAQSAKHTSMHPRAVALMATVEKARETKAHDTQASEQFKDVHLHRYVGEEKTRIDRQRLQSRERTKSSREQLADAKRADAEAVRLATEARETHVVKAGGQSMVHRKDRTAKHIEQAATNIREAHESIREAKMQQASDQRCNSQAAAQVVESIREMAEQRARENKSFASQTNSERKIALVARVQSAAHEYRASTLQRLLTNSIPEQLEQQRTLERKVAEIYTHLHRTSA